MAAGEPGDAVAPVWGVEDRPPWPKRLPLGLQHLLAMILGNVTPPLLVAGGLGMDAASTAVLLQAVLLMAGLATLVQAYPIGRVGGRIPIVMGTSIAFVGPAIAIGTRGGIAMVLGACLVAALVEVVLGLSIVRIRRLFPPLVNAVVVMLIGLTLIPVGMDYMAGGPGAADYGALSNLLLAALVLGITLAFHQLARGFWSHASILIAVVIGFTVAMAGGKVDLAGVGEASWFALPQPLALGMEFEWTAIAVMAVVYVISTMETVGDISGVLAVAGREPTDRELSGGLLADGVMSGLATLFSALPNTSYSQNVGLVTFTGVISRHVTGVCGLLLVGLGLLPKVAAFLAAIPKAVIGGAGLILFAMIFSSGAAIFHRSVELSRRNLVILAVAIGFGLAVELRPQALVALPEGLRLFFGSGLITGGLFALVLNLVLPRRR